MGFIKKITKVLKNAEVVEFDDSSKFVLMSDSHRSDGSLSDGFARNQDIYFYALKHYYKNDYTYIELGDGDELWETKKMADIMDTYSNIFWILSKFYKENRLYLLYGNHDMVKKDKKYVKNHFCNFFDERTGEYISLFQDIEFHEALVLKDKSTDNKILLLHGHQGDLFNDRLWRLTRFLVRYFWRPLERYGVRDPTSTAKNYKKKKIVEKRFIQCIKKVKCLIIAGHTHRPMFPDIGEVPYFNDGSAVHPRCITAIEIDNGRIQLVKWCISVREDGTLAILRTLLAGPRRINDYFNRFK